LEGTGAERDAPAIEHHAEEFSCDDYATEFILDGIDSYAAMEKVSADLVRQKREIGIYFALFAMTLVSRDKWGQSASHPASKSVSTEWRNK
jgi:hypothetical protein